MRKGGRSARTALIAASLALLAALGVGVAFAAEREAAVAKSYRLTAQLSAAQEVGVTKKVVGASGLFSAILTLSGAKGTLSWKLTFTGLSGPALAAHVHLGLPGKSGPVAIPLCGPCKSGAHGSFTGPIGSNSKLLKAILAGATYANVHTKLNPNGEIRGQVKAVPTTAVAAPVSAGTSTKKSGWG